MEAGRTRNGRIIGHKIQAIKMIFRLFSKYPELVCGLSEKSDVSMLLSGDPEKDKEAIKNRSVFFARKGIDCERVVSAGLVHGDRVAKAEYGDGGGRLSGIDALAARDKNLILSITVADCAPVFFFDPGKRAVAVAHCGWRGAEAGLPKKTTEFLKSEFGCFSRDLLVGIGPCLKSCHFEVKEDVADKFDGSGGAIKKKNGKTCLDLPFVIKSQLEESGVKIFNIESDPKCTFCEKDLYFSFRRQKISPVQAMVAYIGLV